MKQKILFYLPAILLSALLIQGCYKDKGNYTYNMPPRPELSLDTLYYATLGDSLIIDPHVKVAGNPHLAYEWKISVPSDVNIDVIDSSASFRILFTLDAMRYGAQLTVINQDNGMKYFYKFVVSGQTAFAKGTTVLTVQNGKTILSFVKPDSTVQADIFNVFNTGIALPTQPTQLVAVPEWQFPKSVKQYWIFGKGGPNTGVRVDANNFIQDRFFKDHFFDAPDTINPFKLIPNMLNVMSGVVNGRLYEGSRNTWNLAPIYGMFSGGAVGDYDLSGEIAYVYSVPDEPRAPSAYIAFDRVKYQFLRFFPTGADPVFIGTSYAVEGDAFDPKNVGMPIERLLHATNGICFAYCRAADKTLYELNFRAQFIQGAEPIGFKALQKRPFPRPELVKADTKWDITAAQIIYFTSGDVVYRYNPGNNDFRQLTTTFNGKAITMMKLLDNNTLAVGVENTLYYLNVSTGVFGTVIKKYDGLPGAPVDMAERGLN
ncbi:hypothetical protein HNQ91_000797 [Filimonas zeae]|uniref:PKD-like family protein n=1 Tax=Filimonas zeae TaxID=1737353 RepID=A0A917IQG6_9BACT|nr:PKD-like family lipoprotein [Filimonas zeae]MDR6337775.1 hypothetical protein [Filimonas zeae]GGH60203.1 hypothetical protein GCM10011379_07800 [Filimonas zeae]